MWKIDQLPNQPMPGADWHAWLVAPDGLHIKIQISGRATEERARIITQQMAGLIRHDAK